MVRKDTCTSVFIAVLFMMAKTWKQANCPSTEEWLRRGGAYIQWNITWPLKKNEIMPFAATWMDPEIANTK